LHQLRRLKASQTIWRRRIWRTTSSRNNRLGKY